MSEDNHKDCADCGTDTTNQDGFCDKCREYYKDVPSDKDQKKSPPRRELPQKQNEQACQKKPCRECQKSTDNRIGMCDACIKTFKSSHQAAKPSPKKKKRKLKTKTYKPRPPSPSKK
jgi:hypothetical protein